MSITFTVNGEERVSSKGSMTPLVDILRDDLLLTGAKVGCREGMCGACTVHIEGKPAVSCLVPLASVDGADIRTVESLAQQGTLSEVQSAIEEHDVVQCGMCFPGIVMSLTSFLETNPVADRYAIKLALVGNICRCTGYERLVDAALTLVRGMDAE